MGGRLRNCSFEQINNRLVGLVVRFTVSEDATNDLLVRSGEVSCVCVSPFCG